MRVNYFSPKYNNTLDKAFYVIADLLVSNYIKSEIGVDVEPNRLAENKTKSVSGGVKLTNQQIQELEMLSDVAIELAFAEQSTNKLCVNRKIDKFKQVNDFWTEISNSITKETFWRQRRIKLFKGCMLKIPNNRVGNPA